MWKTLVAVTTWPVPLLPVAVTVYRDATCSVDALVHRCRCASNRPGSSAPAPRTDTLRSVPPKATTVIARSGRTPCPPLAGLICKRTGSATGWLEGAPDVAADRDPELDGAPVLRIDSARTPDERLVQPAAASPMTAMTATAPANLLIDRLRCPRTRFLRSAPPCPLT